MRIALPIFSNIFILHGFILLSPSSLQPISLPCLPSLHSSHKQEREREKVLLSSGEVEEG